MKTPVLSLIFSLCVVVGAFCDSLLAQTGIPLTPPGVTTSRKVVRSYGTPQTLPQGTVNTPNRRAANYGTGQVISPIRQVNNEVPVSNTANNTNNTAVPATNAVPASTPAPSSDAVPVPELEFPAATQTEEVPIPELPSTPESNSVPEAPQQPEEIPLAEPLPLTGPTESQPVHSAPIAPTLESPVSPENTDNSLLTPGEPRVYNPSEPLPLIGGDSGNNNSQTPSAANQPGAFSTGQGEPGAKALAGPQAPQLIIEKFAPDELLVGKSAVWKTVVKNMGQTVANGVEIRDLVPRGTQLIETNPPAGKGMAGDLIWKIGDLPPGKQVVVSMELMPLDEGKVGSVAQVSFQTATSAEGVVAKPQLALQTQGVREIGIGNSTELTIILSNPGTGTAKNVVLTENVPPQLQHEAKDSVLTYNVGDLKPDQTQTIRLKMTAIRAGKFANILTASADPSLNAESRFEMEVVAPKLTMEVAGPTRRFLEREGAYKIKVTNPGTAPANNVALKVQLPNGLQFVSANNAGSFDRQTRTVQWLLEQLPANDSGEVELVVTPTQSGQQTITYQASADKGIAANGQKECLVEGMAALLTQLSDTNDPVLVGERTTYLINVVNQGSKASENVQVSAQIPPGMEFLNAEGPTKFQVGPNNTIIFEATPQLSAKAEMNYKILVKGTQPGDQRLKLSVISDELSAPVTKEESTQVYQDQQ